MHRSIKINTIVESYLSKLWKKTILVCHTTDKLSTHYWQLPTRPQSKYNNIRGLFFREAHSLTYLSPPHIYQPTRKNSVKNALIIKREQVQANQMSSPYSQNLLLTFQLQSPSCSKLRCKIKTDNLIWL